MAEAQHVTEHFWLLDTRKIWNGTKITDAAPEALRLLSAEEQEKARRFHFLKDAKLSTGSSLLKRLYAVQSMGIPWASVKLKRKDDPVHGKPAIDPPQGDEAPVDFNVSHQAGLVALAGCSTQLGLLGVDITCANERNDKRHIDRDGFTGWIDMHEHAFSEEDLVQMRANTPGLDLDAKIRRFYAFWCLKEAYVKLEGEALLADWLQDVEFQNVRVPRASTSNDANDQTWGERVTNIEVWISGRPRTDVAMVLQAFGEAYFIGTAIRLTPGQPTAEPSYKIVNPETDIYPFATSVEG